MNISESLSKLSRAVRWHRRAVAALLAALAVMAGLSALSPPPEPGHAVLVTSADLPAGHRVTARDLQIRHYPEALLPRQVLTAPDELVGRILAAPVTRGSPMTRAATVSVSLSPGAGELLVPFRVADPSVLALVQVGDRVTVVSAGSDGQVITLASRVRVAAVPSGDGDAGAAGDGPASMLVVAAKPDVASRLAAWSTGQGLGIALG
ncbi:MULTISPECIES: SAF domain-containing protein [unclassified Luteococcus]|uniref:SAF domain-containing protein n=1 Tax=unclassified Luteococcus TaxID=2639923 RepID=UPI00313ED798